MSLAGTSGKPQSAPRPIGAPVAVGYTAYCGATRAAPNLEQGPSMEKVTTETWVTPPRRPTATSQNACLVHIYPTGTNMGQRYPLGETPLVIGRGEDCDVRIQDHSVSRKHARIE